MAPFFNLFSDLFFELDFLEKWPSCSSILRPEMQMFLPKRLMEPSRVKKGRHAFRLVKMHTKRMSALPERSQIHDKSIKSIVSTPYEDQLVFENDF